MIANATNPVPESSESHSPQSSPLLIAAAWLFVGLPLAWGVAQTVRTSMKLFQAPSLKTMTTPSVNPTAPAAEGR